jgi:hypothetical protein
VYGDISVFGTFGVRSAVPIITALIATGDIHHSSRWDRVVLWLLA